MPYSSAQIIRPPSFSFGTLGQHLTRLIQFRDLLFVLTLHRINVRYKQSILGYFWAILHPVLLMLLYSLIFSRFIRVSTDGMPYAVFAFSALLPWTFFSNGISGASIGLASNSHLLLKVYFPREILPLSYVFAAFADFVMASFVLTVLMVYCGVSITANILWAIPAILTLTVFLTGLALLASAFQVRFRDVGMALPLVLQIWMFATPVVYSLASVPAKLRFWYDFNPMVGIVETFRGAVLHGASADWGLLGGSFAISAIVTVGAYIWFKHVEATFADII
jgi:lipopolysaccharide transport system permease protein